MILLPNFLKRYKRLAEKLYASDAVKDVEFSGSTYQVQVVEPGTESGEWAFLQFDDRGILRDSFCSCPESENNRACVHQATAYLYIYAVYAMPLHVRYERSLWNYLCRECAEIVGTKPEFIERRGEGYYLGGDEKGRELLSIKSANAKTTAFLEEMLFNRQRETEETSLKFSNLSEEEINRWRLGHPSFALAYELSFWSDLAKWLLNLQEGQEPYVIDFRYSTKGLPIALKATFSEVEIEWSLSKAMLSSIIPALSTVKSSLVVHNILKEEVERIEYNTKEKRFVIVRRNRVGELGLRKGIDLGHWIFVPKDGFYPKESRFPQDEKQLSQVEKLLNEHADTLKEFCKECVINEMPLPISYQVAFDNKWNLHVDGYLLTPGDLTSPATQFFGTWIYLDGKGFYQIVPREFDEISMTVPVEEVADFISQHRAWFNGIEGFHTHLSTIQSDVKYSVDENKSLTFNRSLAFEGKIIDSKDFGRWVYIPEHGFFSKSSSHSVTAIRSGMRIPESQVSTFINANRDELQMISRFFSAISPIAKAKIDIEVKKNETIAITPKYELRADYKDRKVYFFDEFIYTEGEGFYELEGETRLPEGYTQPVVVEGDDIADFIDRSLKSLMPYVERLDRRLNTPERHNLVAAEIDREEREGKQEYLLKLDYQTNFGVISLSSLWWALHQDKRYLMTDAGLIDLSLQQFQWLRRIGKKRIDRSRNRILMNSMELLRLNASEGLELEDEQMTSPQSLQIFKELKEFKVPEEPDLTGLKSQLRQYQQQGVDWLWFLYHQGLSGLLCDDMGLGKTHQAMALLAAISNYWRKKGEVGKRHFLVVCPTSVIYHWQEKLSEFLPTLRVGTFYGANRKLDNFYETCDILLTSYGVWRNEVDVLSKLNFEVAIFDELQIAKNQLSRIYSALLKSKSRMRLGLTGTPIENRIRELKTLFDLVLPAYMPSEHEFRDKFIKPIEKEGNQEQKRLLARLIKPLVLRRKKEDVLLDLPEKIETIAHCDLLPDQKQLYVDVLSFSRDKIIQELQNDQTPIPYVHIFALLSRLKQVCNHPAAYLRVPEDYKKYHSGKWDLFVELLEEARESQQKVVVFSHYLPMLDIIENYLTEQRIGFAAIRGATVKRGEQLQKFNNNPKCEVFVASLQAAGLGVDLTAGSVVIHYDRWWNAARENQATDRVHRIGQTRGVQVFKLMTKGTLEEHIDYLISKKGKLMEDVVGVDDHQVIKQFTRQEIIDLLQG